MLAHTRLAAIIGLGAAGQQPKSDGPQALTFNGELYNYLEQERIKDITVETGQVQGDEKQLLLRGSDVFALPSQGHLFVSHKWFI